MAHKRGEIVDEIPNAIPMNTLRGIPLDICYYLSNNRIYKRLVSGKYRALVKQETRKEYQHYFFRDRNKKKLTLNVNKMHLLTYNPNEVAKEESKETPKEESKEAPKEEKSKDEPSIEII
jgi:hypothetical protein